MSVAVTDYFVAAILWSGIVIYACFAGADFGGGVWDLSARGRARRSSGAPSPAAWARSGRPTTSG